MRLPYPLLLAALFVIGMYFLSPSDPMEIRVKGTTYYLEGQITEDTLSNFKYNVETVRVTRVSLTSQGGYLYPALKIADIIRDEGITTKVVGKCNSACGYVALAGSAVFLEAPIGIHSIYSAESGEPVSMDSRAVRKAIQSVEASGFSSQYVYDAMTVPPEAVAYLYADDLNKYYK